MIAVRVCTLAAREHRKDPRAYAHTFHYESPGADVVCVAPDYYHLPDAFKYGVFLHELGHLALKHRAHTEEEAERKAEEISGVLIYRRSFGPALSLQCVRRCDLNRARSFIIAKTLE